MKRLLFTLAFLPLMANAQTQTFNSVSRFVTNVFLHDSTTPLHLRVPTNAVIDGVTSTNGSLTVTTNGAVVNLAVVTTALPYLSTTGGAVSGNASISGVLFVNNIKSTSEASNAAYGLTLSQQASTNTMITLVHGMPSFGTPGTHNGVILSARPYNSGTFDFMLTQTNMHLPRQVIETGGGFAGDASRLTNFPATIVTTTSANTNYYRFTTAPASNTAFGLQHQIAYNSTNIFIYHAASSKWLRVTGTLEW